MKTTAFSILILICGMTVFTHVSLAQDPEFIVRVIYFLPNDREPQQDIDRRLDTFIKHQQEFFAVNMENHGFGKKSFQIETDNHGNAIVHHVRGKHPESIYRRNPWVYEEISRQFDLKKNIYLVLLQIDATPTFANVGHVCGLGARTGTQGGMALLPAGGCFNSAVAAHELAHAFGVAHDRLIGETRIPALDVTDGMATSFCAAHWMDIHRYFNLNRAYATVDRRTSMQMLPPVAKPPYSIRLRFQLTDSDGLHQAQILNAAGETIAYKVLKGHGSTVEFVTTRLGLAHEKTILTKIQLRVIDVQGNIVQNSFPIDLDPLLSREVILIPDANLSAVIRETIGLGPTDPIRQNDLLKLTELNASNRQITDLTGIGRAINLRRLNLMANQIQDVSPLSSLTNLIELNLSNNLISDISALAGLRGQISLHLSGNPGSGNGSPKIEGPWLWMIAPTGIVGGKLAVASGIDFLAQASGGSVTEQQIATEGAMPGEIVGNKVWTLSELTSTSDNITRAVDDAGLAGGNINNHVAYGLIVLDSPKRQETTMYVGSDDAVKVWFNGVSVHTNPVDRGASDYQDFFPVTLKHGKNILLVAIYNYTGSWSGFFGFKKDTVYSLSTETETDSTGTTTSPTRPDLSTHPIVFSEIMFESEGGETSLPQWIEVSNNRTSEINLRGWKLGWKRLQPSLLEVTTTFKEDFRIPAHQSRLIVTALGRHSMGSNLSNDVVYQLHVLHAEELAQDDIANRNRLITRGGFSLKLINPNDVVVDQIGTLNGTQHTWQLPESLIEGARSSLIRRFDKGVPRSGLERRGWRRAYDTKRLVAGLYYGHQSDLGTPGYRRGKPLPVELSQFSARFDKDRVVIRWTTASELNNAGFNILRSDSRDGEFTQVNEDMIQGNGTTGQRSTYQWVDITAKPHAVYYYRIEDVSFAGERQTLATTKLKGLISAKGKLTTTWGILKSSQ